MSPEQPSKLLTTALAVIAGYNSWNMDAILAPRAPNCTHRVYPNRLGRPTLNITEYDAYFSSLLPYFKNFTVTVVDAYVDEAANRVALQAASTATSVIGPYANEYVVMMKMTECKTQVYEVREFVDSESSANFFPNLTAYIAGDGPGLYGDLPKSWRGLPWDKNA
ncbi:hypothetical protein DE146DRAFT_773845 [Phaeosphaeria sp. MPI-PUGE-AT-0046c]|nr:hypothetical protein DE146DRAFT_773845 [Phaeosphaeria sp. MPI-PUGE-AT-0046c]